MTVKNQFINNVFPLCIFLLLDKSIPELLIRYIPKLIRY